MGVATAMLCTMTGVFSVVYTFGPIAGPYEIDVQKLEICENQGSGKIVFRPRITNAGKGKYVYNENFTFGVPFDEHIKGNYTANKWLLEFNFQKYFPVMEYGKYRAIPEFFYKKEMVGCYKMYGEIIPKTLF